MQPPNIYFYDGSTIHGGLKYEPTSPLRTMPQVDHSTPNWDHAYITAETDKTATDHGGLRISVQAAAAQLVTKAPLPPKTRRWILGNDGRGELADLIVLEIDDQRRVKVGLWHVKPSGKDAPAARVGGDAGGCRAGDQEPALADGPVVVDRDG